MKHYTATLKLDFKDVADVIVPADEVQRCLESHIEDAIFRIADCFGIVVQDYDPLKFEEDLTVREIEQEEEITEKVTSDVLRKAAYDCLLEAGYGLSLSERISITENVPDLLKTVATLLFEDPRVELECFKQVKILRKAQLNLKNKGTYY